MQTPSYYQEVYAIVRLIPRGMVMSYGGVARQSGRPGQARAVGYALHSLPQGSRVPWWRVINSQGRISIPWSEGAEEQRRRLIAEGVPVDDNFRVDLRAYDAEMVVYEKRRKGEEEQG
jgi:methylated-DNA-protein-cysteine methyltransferase related protein